jgi:hypothetical protein
MQPTAILVQARSDDLAAFVFAAASAAIESSAATSDITAPAA